MVRSTRTNRGWQCHACVQENPVGEKPVFRRETVQTEYTEVECILQSLGRAGYEGEKRVKKRSRGRGGGEKRACIFHAKSSSRSRAARALLADSSRRRRTVETTRVRLPSTFLDSVIRGKRREGGRERRLVQARVSASQREEKRELYEALRTRAFVLSRARGWSSLPYCALYICTVYVRIYRYRVWKNCISSMEKLGPISSMGSYTREAG